MKKINDPRGCGPAKGDPLQRSTRELSREMKVPVS